MKRFWRLLVGFLGLNMLVAELHVDEQHADEDHAGDRRGNGQVRQVDIGGEQHQGANKDQDGVQGALLHGERGLCELLGQNVGQLPAGQQDHELGQHIGADAHVGDQGQVHAGQDGDRAHGVEDHQQDDGGAGLVLLSHFLRQPAVAGSSLQAAGDPAQGAVQGGQQGKHSAAEDEEEVQPGGEDLLGDQGQVLECNILNGQHAGSDDANESIEHGNDGGGQDDGLGDGVGGVLDVVGVLTDELRTAAGKAQQSNAGEEVHGAVGHGVGSADGQRAPIDLGQAEADEQEQADEQESDHQVLDDCSGLQANDVDDGADGQSQHRHQHLVELGEDGAEVACKALCKGSDQHLAQHEHADVHEAGLIAHQALDVGVACTGSGDGSRQDDVGHAGQDGQQSAQDERVRGAVARHANDDARQDHDAGTDDLTGCHAHAVHEVQLFMAGLGSVAHEIFLLLWVCGGQAAVWGSRFKKPGE